MKSTKTRLIYAFSLFSLMAVQGCGVNDIYIDNGNGVPGGENPPVVNGTMTDYHLSGFVTDTDGNPLSGVSVISGTSQTLTDANGVFSLQSIDVNHARSIVRFEKDGYFPVVKSSDTPGETCQVVMASTIDSDFVETTSFSSTSAQTVATKELSIAFPANAFKVASSGESYSGTVNVNVLHLSPENASFTEMMPGSDLMALRENGEECVLVSYGMANVMLTDKEGNKLQLADGKEAELSCRIPASMTDNAPDEIPLWSFDETRGLWTQELTARKNADGTYSGKASHFSWVNFDDDSDVTYISGVVSNTEGQPLPNIEICINNQLKAYTDENGRYTKRVPSDCTFPVSITSDSYGGYSPVVNISVNPIPKNTIYQLDITLPKLYTAFGRIIYENGDPVKSKYAYTCGLKSFPPKFNLPDGRFFAYLPKDYKGHARLLIDPERGISTSVDFDIPGDRDIDLGDIIINVFDPLPGAPDITAKCQGEDTHYLSVTDPGAFDFAGVIIEDSSLIVINNTDLNNTTPDTNLFMLSVDNYSPSVTEYNNARLVAYDNGKMVMSEENTLTITRDGNIFYFNLSGNGVYASSAASPKEALITVNNVGISHLLTAEWKRNYTPGSQFPAFTPKLATPAPIAMVVSDSEKLGKGGMLFYNGEKPEYDDLRSQAARTNLDLLSDEFEDGYGETAYKKGTDMIMIDFDQYMHPITPDTYSNPGLFTNMFGDGSDDDEDNEVDSQLSVTAFSGGSISFLDIFSGDDYLEMPKKIAGMRKAARKLQRIRKATK